MRPVVLIVVLLLLAGGAYSLSTVPAETPVKTIEVDVTQPGNAN